jgi:SAM-dependent methyltransferase
MITPALSPAASLRFPLIRDHLLQVRPDSIIEVGCGQGAMGVRLAQHYQYRGYEPDPTSFQVAQRRLALVGRGTVVNAALPPVPDRRFDLLVAFEVLEHIEDDLGALRSWSSWVRPGGSLLLSTPAHPHRFGPSDAAVGHYRRYTRGGLETLLSAAGLKVESIECWGMPLGYLLEWARNAWVRRRPASPSPAEGTARSGRFFQPPTWLGPTVEWLALPFALLQLPFRRTDLGIGYVVRAGVAR